MYFMHTCTLYLHRLDFAVAVAGLITEYIDKSQRQLYYLRAFILNVETPSKILSMQTTEPHKLHTNTLELFTFTCNLAHM